MRRGILVLIALWSVAGVAAPSKSGLVPPPLLLAGSASPACLVCLLGDLASRVDDDQA